MKFIFASYVVSAQFTSPEPWLNHIKFYTGILDALAETHKIISIEQIDYEGDYQQNGVNYHFIQLSKNGRRFPNKLHRFIKSQHPDVVFIQGLHFPLQVLQLRLALGSKVKIIVQNHAEQPYKGIKKYSQRLADRYVDAYLFASKDMGMDWVKHGNLASPKKIHEVMEVSSIFYPIEKQLALSKTEIKGKHVFLWVGRLNQNKDPLNVIRAFLRFAGLNPEAHLFMIFHTNELLAEVNEILTDHPDKASVTMVGQVPHNELLYWFNSADFILSGSHYEGSGTVICEAMSCGCLPIVTDIFSFRMITDNGKCGILYEPGNEDALLAALHQTKTIDKEERRQLSLDYFKSNLSFQAIANQIQDIANTL